MSKPEAFERRHVKITKTSARGHRTAHGLYRFRVTALKDIPELTDVRIDCTITWDARIQLPESFRV